MAADLSASWHSRFVFERALALVYLLGFVGAVNQFVPLLGARGLLPVARFTALVPFRSSPSLFHFWQTDTAFRVAAWAGVVLAVALLLGLPQRLGAAAVAVAWLSLWVLYLSFVNVGQTFYGFGWELILLEAGFFAAFLGGRETPPSPWLTWIWAWLLFRVMFGAGMIKLRGDPCWRDLTCLDYYFETQPIPNPLSWHFHWLPSVVHRAGVAFNHAVELVVPFFYFAPQPIAGVAALLTIVFQLVLIVSGNLSWLNWLTVVISLPLLDDRWWGWLPVAPPAMSSPPTVYRVAVFAALGLVAVLSVQPIRNILSRRQLMNFSFNRLHLVGTYGAFGSITRTRYEIAIEGTTDDAVTPETVWREYAFKGKPGDPGRRPPQIAPYHLRLDWLMWFAAMSPRPRDVWFYTLVDRLLEGDRAVTGLLASNPFADAPPRFVRARYYRYRFTTPEERRATGEWWRREPAGEYLRPMRRRSPAAPELTSSR
jgi:hypothetical protein